MLEAGSLDRGLRLAKVRFELGLERRNRVEAERRSHVGRIGTPSSRRATRDQRKQPAGSGDQIHRPLRGDGSLRRVSAADMTTERRTAPGNGSSSRYMAKRSEGRTGLLGNVLVARRLVAGDRLLQVGVLLARQKTNLVERGEALLGHRQVAGHEIELARVLERAPVPRGAAH